MKIFLRFTVYGLVIASLAGCSLLGRRPVTGTGAKAIGLPSYSGPKARIAVIDFKVEATKASVEIGSAVRETLIAALSNSNRFLIVERQQAQAQAMKELELSVSGAPQTGNGAAEKSAARAADLVITVSLTEFEPQLSGGRAGVGGGGGAGSGVLGGLLGTSLNKAHIALEISIVDASTSKVLANTRIQGQASDVGTAAKDASSGGGLGAGLSVYANTPMEKAIRICIIEAARYIYQAVPERYYKY